MRPPKPTAGTAAPFALPPGWARAAILIAAAWLHNMTALANGPVAVSAATPTLARPTSTLTLEQDAARIAENVREAIARATATQRASPPAPDRPAGRAAAPQASTPPQGWTYGDGPGNPRHWGQLAPQYSACATGQRQSPIAIDHTLTLQGPAEPLLLVHTPTGGTVVHTGHTLQVELPPGNSLTVRGRQYELVQLHFHHPAEIQVNHKTYAMAAHLVHRDAAGGLAIVAVPLEAGAANPLIERVWTHLPLEAGDRVPVPAGLLDMAGLMPQDPRYYQFMGSLTTPPCTEGVLWMVMQQPVTLSPEQLRLFAQLFPHNARPVQPVNGRVVRQGM